MYQKKYSAIVYLLSFLFLNHQAGYAQICVDDHFSVNYNTATVQNPVAAISDAQDEITMAGNVFRYNSLLQGGWLTKFSAQGTILWSKHYYTGTFNFLNFTNIVADGNDNFLITGNIGDVDTTVWPLAHLTEYAFLMKADKYGNIIWTKMLQNLIRPFAYSDINSIIKTNDGDFILALGYYTTKSYNAIIRINGDGKVKWTMLVTSPLMYPAFGNVILKQLSNGNLVFAEYASVFDDIHPYQRRGYYMACVDAATGERLWNRFFIGRDTLSFTDKVFTDIINITELPNHDLSFITSYAPASIPSYLRKTDRVLNFVTDSFGILKKVLSYTSATPPLYATSVAEFGKSGDRAILMDNGDTAYMIGINDQGEMLWQKAYGGIGRTQETKNILHTNYGFYFFSLTHNGGSKDPKLVKTDTLGNIPCVESGFTATAEDATAAYFMQNLSLTYEKSPSIWSDLPVPGVYNYFIQGTDICRIACCKDVTDTAGTINLCNEESFALPNNDVVKNSGTYTVTYKTSEGCDSIVYYNINFFYTPKVSLGGDTCFSETDSLILKTEPGYDTYAWNGINTANSTYIARQPGVYIVQVSNECGTNADTLQILEKCEFEIYMPNAFTPNGDGRNDVFRVPPQINNRLISFAIYNRWGQIVFITNNINEGWNGIYNSMPATTDTYIYQVVMETIDGKKRISKKGWVLLLR